LIELRDKFIEWGVFAYARDIKRKTDCEIVTSTVTFQGKWPCLSHTIAFVSARKWGFRHLPMTSPRVSYGVEKINIDFTTTKLTKVTGWKRKRPT
jgi:hypothetical protein